MAGPWQFWDQDPAPESRAHITNYRKSPSDTIFFQDSPGVVAGALFADALNVHEATGLTPSQLQARVAELEAALREALWLAQSTDLVRAEDPLWNHLLETAPK